MWQTVRLFRVYVVHKNKVQVFQAYGSPRYYPLLLVDYRRIDNSIQIQFLTVRPYTSWDSYWKTYWLWFLTCVYSVHEFVHILWTFQHQIHFLLRAAW